MYEELIEHRLAPYPNVEVSAVDGYDIEFDKATITYVIDVGGVPLSYRFYTDAPPMSAGELEDLMEDIEARVNLLA